MNDTTASNDVTIHPPDVIRRYQDAHDRHDTETALATFTADARVIDEEHEYNGTDDIRRWLTTAATEFTYTRTLVAATALDAETWLVVNRLEGDFPGRCRGPSLPVPTQWRPHLRAPHRSLTSPRSTEDAMSTRSRRLSRRRSHLSNPRPGTRHSRRLRPDLRRHRTSSAASRRSTCSPPHPTTFPCTASYAPTAPRP